MITVAHQIYGGPHTPKKREAIKQITKELTLIDSLNCQNCNHLYLMLLFEIKGGLIVLLFFMFVH